MSKSDDAVKYIFDRIQADPRLAYYLGPGTQSFDLLVSAEAERTGSSEDELIDMLRGTLGTEPPKCGWMQCDPDNCE